MGQIMINDLDDTVLEALRRRAAACGTSIEEEAHRVLASALGLDRLAAVQQLDMIRRKIGRLDEISSGELLRRDRDRDSL